MGQEILDEAFDRGVKVERERCARIVCPDCAKGVSLSEDFEHVLETYEGHALHVRVCLAKRIFCPL